MKALKRLKRMEQATEELRLIISMLPKGEQGKPNYAIKETSGSHPDDSEKRAVKEKASGTNTAKKADLLISEVAELLGESEEERSTRTRGENELLNTSALRLKGGPKNQEDRSVPRPSANDAEDESDADCPEDFWVSLASQEIRI